MVLVAEQVSTLHDAINSASPIFAAATDTPVNAGNTAYVLLCTMLVFFMIPGLGFFYAGLDRRRFALTIVMQCLISIPITAFIWIFGGFGLAFGPNIGGGFLGNPQYFFLLNGVDGHNMVGIPDNTAAGVPLIVFFIYQLMFAIITPPLMTGAFADRMTWGKYIIFIILWEYLIYIPICHWIWGGGFLAHDGVLDWAGGIVIHTTAGFGALAAVLVLGKRKPMKNNAPFRRSSSMLVMLGIALLWFGWFGFNSGGAMGINAAAIRGFVNTALAPCFTMITWLILEYATTHRRMSATSVAGAFVGGLAGITPAAGFIPIWAAWPVGVIVGLASFGTLSVVRRIKKVDDAMDVFSVHGMTGFVGAILIGVFMITPSTITIMGSAPYTYAVGGIFGTPETMPMIDLGHGYMFGIQIAGAVLGAAWAFVWTIIILWPIVKISKKIPIAYHTYKTSWEEEMENENPYDGDEFANLEIANDEPASYLNDKKFDKVTVIK